MPWLEDMFSGNGYWGVFMLGQGSYVDEVSAWGRTSLTFTWQAYCRRNRFLRSGKEYLTIESSSCSVCLEGTDCLGN